MKLLKVTFICLLALASISSSSFISKEPTKLKGSVKSLSSVTDYAVYVDSAHYPNFPKVLQIVIVTDHTELVWWKARVQVHMYFDGGIGHYSTTWPYHWVTDWGWGYKTFDAEMSPGYTAWWTDWNLQEGEIVDDTDVTVISFNPE